tara:strand:+ start:537 stop:800 length:264 start_codon:yes stop_codon:yes gene_type:complete
MANQVKANRHCKYITVDTMAECVDGIEYGSELYLALWNSLDHAKAPVLNDDYEDRESQLDRISVKALWKHFDDEQRRKINALLAAEF